MENKGMKNLETGAELDIEELDEIAGGKGTHKGLRALGLKKIGSAVKLPDNPTIRGQIIKTEHLVKVEEV